MQPVFSDNAPSLPVAEQAAQEVLSLPMWPGISRADGRACGRGNHSGSA